jgi:DNA-binding transcriptional ArsR family regulator
MAELELPSELRELIRARLSSIEQVDVLMYLLRSGGERTVGEVASALGIARETAGMRLFLLSSAGLLDGNGSPEVRYGIAAAAAPLVPLLQTLATAYEADRNEVSQSLFQTAADPLRSFADAFKLKKPK